MPGELLWFDSLDVRNVVSDTDFGAVQLVYRIGRLNDPFGYWLQMNATKARTLGLCRRRVVCRIQSSTSSPAMPHDTSSPVSSRLAMMDSGSMAAPAPATAASRTASSEDSRNTGWGSMM